MPADTHIAILSPSCNNTDLLFGMSELDLPNNRAGKLSEQEHQIIRAQAFRCKILLTPVDTVKTRPGALIFYELLS